MPARKTTKASSTDKKTTTTRKKKTTSSKVNDEKKDEKVVVEAKPISKKTTTTKATTKTTSTAAKKKTTSSKVDEAKKDEKVVETKPVAKKTTTTKAVSIKKTASTVKKAVKKASKKAEKKVDKVKEEVKKIVIDLNEPNKVADEFKKAFDDAYDRCTITFNKDIDFVGEKVISNPNTKDYYKGNVIVDSYDNPVLEDSSSGIAKVASTYVSSLYSEDNQKKMNSLLLMKSMADKDIKVKIIKELAEYVLSKKVAYVKGDYIKNYHNLYEVSGYLNIMSDYYKQDKSDLSDAYKVALFNLNNINNIITDFLDKTVNYIYSIYEFGLTTAIQFDK